MRSQKKSWGFLLHSWDENCAWQELLGRLIVRSVFLQSRCVFLSEITFIDNAMFWSYVLLNPDLVT